MAKRTIKKRGASGRGSSNELKDMVMMALLAGVAYGAEQLLQKHSKSGNLFKLLQGRGQMEE